MLTIGAIKRRLVVATTWLMPVRPPSRRHRLAEPLYVSLTSHPPRYRTLGLTLKCLLSQSVRPDGILLWIPQGTRNDLPRAVTRLRASGLTINEVPADYRSYNKIVHTLPLYPEASIAIADDDVSYHRDWLAGLVNARIKDPTAILGYRAVVIGTRTDGTIAPYLSWRPASPDDAATVMVTGVGGVLYPPHSLHPDTTNARLFTRICPNADDLWLRWMAFRRGTPVKSIAGFREPAIWPGSQKIALRHQNVDGGENDAQVAALVREYGSPEDRKEASI